MKHFACILAISLLSLAAAQPELSQPKPGPFALRGSKLWSIGPASANDTFVIPENDPFGRVPVLTGVYCPNGGGVLLWDTGSGGSQVFIPSLDAVRLIRPGLVLPPGEYTFGVGTGNVVLCGYMAPPPNLSYSGSDEYPNRTLIWRHHTLTDGGSDFTVPQGQVYVLTFFYGRLLRHDGQTFQQVLDYLGSWTDWQVFPLPGYRLPPGQYRIQRDSRAVAVCGGYLTTEF